MRATLEQVHHLYNVVFVVRGRVVYNCSTGPGVQQEEHLIHVKHSWYVKHNDKRRHLHTNIVVVDA